MPRPLFDSDREGEWVEHGEWIVRFDDGRVRAMKREEFEPDFKAMDDAAHVEMNLL